MVDDYLVLMDGIGKRMSERLIRGMQNHSIRNPELVSSFNFSSSGEMIGKPSFANFITFSSPIYLIGANFVDRQVVFTP